MRLSKRISVRPVFFLALFFLSLFLPLFTVNADEVQDEFLAIKAEKKEILRRVESVKEKIGEAKLDRKVFDYVLDLVKRASRLTEPNVTYSQYAAEISRVEKEMSKARQEIKDLRPEVSRVHGRLQFVDRDIAIRELLGSFSAEDASVIRESLIERKQKRLEYDKQLKSLESQHELLMMKLDFIVEYRNSLERSRWRWFKNQFVEKKNLTDLSFYLVKKLFLTFLFLGVIIVLYRSVKSLIKKIPIPASISSRDAGFKEICGMFIFVSVVALFILGFCGLLEIWDFGASRLALLWKFLAGIQFVIGVSKITIISLAQAALVICLFWLAGRLLNIFLVRAVYPRMQLDESLQYSYSMIIRYVFFAIGFIAGLHALGIPLSSLSIFTGALGISIGIGLQELFKNFISGLNLLMERSVKVGDLIQVGDLPGKVREINAQNTVVDTFDNISVVIPNLEFTNQRIINWSHSDKVIRISLSVGVAYGSDTQLVKLTLLEAAASHPKILKYPEPSIIFEGFGDSSLNFKLFAWIDEPERKLSILSDLYFKVDQNFREQKIEIPFPQRDIHFKTPGNLIAPSN